MAINSYHGKRLPRASSVSDGIIIRTEPVDRNDPLYSSSLIESSKVISESWKKPMGINDMANLATYRMSPGMQEVASAMGIAKKEIESNPMLIEDIALNAFENNPDAYDRFLEALPYAEAVLTSYMGGTTDEQKTTEKRIQPKRHGKMGTGSKILLGLLAAGSAAAAGIYYLENQDKDGDGIPDYRDPHPDLHESVYNYAKGVGISDSVVQKMQLKGPIMDNGNINKNITTTIDYIGSQKDANLQSKLTDGFFSDKIVTKDEARQAEFLKTLSQAEQAGLINSGKFTNTNFDGDIYSNWFEKFISHTDPNVPNNLYVVLSSSQDLNPKDFGSIIFEIDAMKSNLIQKGNIKPENIININNASYNDFLKTMNEVSQRATPDDIIFLALSGHGSPGTFNFADKGVTYSDLDKYLDTIESKVLLLTVDACYSGSAVDYIKDSPQPRVILTQVDDKQTAFDYNSAYFLVRSLTEKEADRNGNGFVSLEEALASDLKYLSNEYYPQNKGEPCHPQMSSNANILDKTYLIEYDVNDN